MKHHYILLFLLSYSISSLSQDTFTYSQPKHLNDGWKTEVFSTSKEHKARIDKLFNQLQHKKHDVHSIVLIKNNTILIEKYFDTNSYDKPHDMRSVTKSIISILMGIAIDKGYVDSVDDPISKYLKNFVPTKNWDHRKEKITIAHLLSMSTGLDCNDWDKKSKGQEDKVYKKKDWIKYTLNLPMINEPGTVSNYCTMGVVLAAEIISQASGMSIDLFAKKYVFDHLNIQNISWGHTSKGNIIPSAKRLYMISRDLAKIGKLILQDGKWNDQQIVSKEWIQKSTSPKTKITGLPYGYLWWEIPLKVNEKTVPAIAATGNGGQYLMIFPEINVIAVFTGGAYNSQEDKLPFVLMQKAFLPAFID